MKLNIMNKSKKTCLIIILLIFTMVSAYSQMEAIKERGVLVVAMVKSDQKPFFYTNKDGQYVGLDVDIAKGIAKQLGVRVEFDRTAESFAALIPLVEEKKVDLIISKLSRTLARSQRVLYSNPYVIFRQALLFDRLELAKKVSTDEALTEYVKNFTGSMGVIAGSSYFRYSSINFPNATIFSYPVWDDVINALLNKEVSAIYRDQLEIEKILTNKPGATINYRMIVLSDAPDNIAIALNKDDILLLNFINLYLESAIPRNLNAKYLLDTYND